MAGDSRSVGLTIGAVLEQLKPEFPTISISKIRYLESEGLITPSRSRSGYRSYTESDVARLRYILQAQQERFWPLRVIREALDAMDRGLEAPEPSRPRPTVPMPPADDDVPAAGYFASSGAELRLTADELCRSSGLDRSMLDALVTYGLLRPGAGGHFTADSLPVAAAAGALAAYGIEARHLRPFRTAADREIGLAQQVLATTRTRDAQEARERRADLLHHALALHAALVKAALAGD